MSTEHKDPADQNQTGSKVQGEGDYEATRRYDKDTERFLKSANVEDLARKAAPKSKAEAEDMKKAEDVGLQHRAGTDKGSKD